MNLHSTTDLLSSSESKQLEPVPLEVVSLFKRFGQVTAVDGLSLQLSSGECLGLLGPNGAGKSTLIRSIVGRVLPDAGSVSIFGSSASTSEAREALGWVPQEPALYPRLSCEENLTAFGRYHGLSGAHLAESVAWGLEWAALTDRAADLAHDLSGGMKRRLNMAAGIIHRPKVVLMDEPTVGVDPQSRNRIFEMIEALGSAGTAIVYTTHYMEEAERLCDRIAIMDHGRIIAQGSSEELVLDAFAHRSQVLARFDGALEDLSAWVERHQGQLVIRQLNSDALSHPFPQKSAEMDGAPCHELLAGSIVDGVAQFTIEHSNQIAALLDDAAQAGLELVDVTVRRPNLESVFLHLTGRELRD